ncbi:MAG: sugar phosphate isomerase/epimerase, partial [Bacteroidia bacterium]|nr:sugar phosphate isomerase/epimerase [Bacteroidia bacterium]
MRKIFVLAVLAVLSVFAVKAQQPERPGPQPAPETGEKFKVGMAGYTFVKFDLDKTLETMKRADVHYLCIKDLHLPMN